MATFSASTAPLSTESAIRRAQTILASGTVLMNAAENLARAQRENKPNHVVEAAEVMRDDALLDYRVSSAPDTLAPILAALILAAETKK